RWAAVRSTVPHPYVRLSVELLLALVGASLLVWAWRVDPRWFEIHFTNGYFFVTPNDERMAKILRLVGAALGLVLVVSARFIGARAGRHSAGRLLAICLPILAAIYFALVTSEVILRRRENRERVDRVEIRMGVPDPRMAWQWRPGANEVVEVGGRKLLYAF